MKKMIRSVLMSTLAAVGVACAIFCLAGVIYDIIGGGNFTLSGYGFTKMAAATLVVGLGFGLPTFAYQLDRLSKPVQVLIHMGIGCVVMTVTAFVVGWVPTAQGVPAAVAAVLSELAAAFLLWLAFYLHQRRLARRLNRHLAAGDNGRTG